MLNIKIQISDYVYQIGSVETQNCLLQMFSGFSVEFYSKLKSYIESIIIKYSILISLRLNFNNPIVFSLFLVDASIFTPQRSNNELN